MRRTPWEIIRVFLLIWLGLGLVLCVVSVARNWDRFAEIVEGSFASLLSSLFLVALAAVGVFLIIRSMFR